MIDNVLRYRQFSGCHRQKVWYDIGLLLVIHYINVLK